MLDQLKTMAWVTFFMAAPELIFSIEDIINGNANIFELTSEINVFGYILGFSIVIVISALTDFITQKVMFKIKRISMIVWEIIVAVLAITSFIVFLMLKFGDSTWDIPVWIAALVSGLYLFLYYIFNRNRLKARKEHEVKFWDEVKKDMGS